MGWGLVKLATFNINNINKRLDPRDRSSRGSIPLHELFYSNEQLVG